MTAETVPGGRWPVNGYLPPPQITTARWLNRKRRVRDPNPKGGETGYTDRWSKVLAHTGPYKQFAYGTDTPSDWRGPLQRCIVCCPSSGLIAVDVDYPEQFATTRTAKLIGREQALTTRGRGYHILLDCRAIPPDDWPPKQIPIAGADIKSCGFIPWPGSEHFSGERYELTEFGRHGRGYVTATPELIEAILADQADIAVERERCRAERGNGHGGGDGGGHDGEVAATVLSNVLRGLSKDECYEQWLEVAIPRDPSWPYEREDFERHYGTAARKAEQIRAGEPQVDETELAQLASMDQEGADSAPVQGVVVPRPKPSDYVTKEDGLKAAKAASWVMAQGPLLYGIDNKLWAYQHGVWVPGETTGNDVVLKRITHLLADKYRPGHATTIKDMIRAQGGFLRCDPVPEVINFRDGLLYWETEDEVQPHTPDVLSTVQLGVRWNPQATCPEFDKFLASVLQPGDVLQPGQPATPSDVDRMWELIGYLMMSGNPLHKIILLYGWGFNGKGTLLRVLTRLLRKDSVSSVSLAALADNRFAPIRTVGKVANMCGDIDATYIERTGLLKQLAGEDAIDAEHKFRDATQFTCWAVPMFSANEMPTSSDTSHGWFKRWEVFTFPNQFEHTPGLEAGLMAESELEGIAARGVRELRAWAARGRPDFTRTTAGDASKAEFVTHQDPLAVWLAEDTWTHQSAWTDRRAAHARYMDWCEGAGQKRTLGRTKFYTLMRERFPEVRRDGWPGYAGLALR